MTDKPSTLPQPTRQEAIELLVAVRDSSVTDSGHCSICLADPHSPGCVIELVENLIHRDEDVDHSLPPPPQAREELVIEICRELYDRFVMGGGEPQDAHAWLRGKLLAASAPQEAGVLTIEAARKWRLKYGVPPILYTTIAVGMGGCTGVFPAETSKPIVMTLEPYWTDEKVAEYVRAAAERGVPLETGNRKAVK